MKHTINLITGIVCTCALGILFAGYILRDPSDTLTKDITHQEGIYSVLLQNETTEKTSFSQGKDGVYTVVTYYNATPLTVTLSHYNVVVRNAHKKTVCSGYINDIVVVPHKIILEVAK